MIKQIAFVYIMKSYFSKITICLRHIHKYIYSYYYIYNSKNNNNNYNIHIHLYVSLREFLTKIYNMTSDWSPNPVFCIYYSSQGNVVDRIFILMESQSATAACHSILSLRLFFSSSHLVVWLVANSFYWQSLMGLQDSEIITLFVLISN